MIDAGQLSTFGPSAAVPNFVNHSSSNEKREWKKCLKESQDQYEIEMAKLVQIKANSSLILPMYEGEDEIHLDKKNRDASCRKQKSSAAELISKGEVCLSESKRIYDVEIDRYKKIQDNPEVSYARLYDDEYGKGMNTITKEILDREEICNL